MLGAFCYFTRNLFHTRHTEKGKLLPMRGLSNFLASLKAGVYRWRWWISALLSAVFIGLEISEHWPQAIKGFSLVDTVIKGLAFPLLIGALLSLQGTREKLGHAVNQLDMQKVVKRQLEDARDWDELVTILLQIPRMILPLTGDALIVLDPETSEYSLVSEWSFYGSRPASTPTSILDMDCMAKLLSEEPAAGLIGPCTCSNEGEAAEVARSYCLPLYHGDRPIAMLRLNMSLKSTVRADRLNILASVAPDMAHAIDRFQMGRLMAGQSSHYLEERQRLARYLHDTLAHNLAYLRLKIEQLSTDSSYPGIEAFQKDLQRLLPVADQSYEQVRSSLRDLQDTTPADITPAIQEYAADLGRRAQFSIDVLQEGTPKPLAPHVSRQVLYILREALRNVEKHADAHKVAVRINWSGDRLIVETSDDGRGFSPVILESRTDSYGMQIMQECASELNGRLSISSQPGRGTSVQLWVPL